MTEYISYNRQLPEFSDSTIDEIDAMYTAIGEDPTPHKLKRIVAEYLQHGLSKFVSGTDFNMLKSAAENLMNDLLND